MSESVLLLESVLKGAAVDKKIVLLLRACSERQILTYELQNKISDVVTTINSRLNELSQRSTGIRLLKYFLTQCPDAVFTENCVSWMLACVKGAGNESSEVEAHDTLRMLLEMSHHFQELTKPLASKVFPKLLEHLLKFYKSRAALQCLQELFHRYPASCKKNAKDIRKTLLRLVDEEDKELVEYAARCVCYLPLIMTTDGRNPWTDLQTTLCATASTVMYELFENIHEHIIPAALSDLPAGFSLGPVKTDDPVVSVYLVANRLINILTFIKGMLQGELKSIKEIRVDLLVALANRGLSVNCNMLNKGCSMERTAVLSVLTDVHVALLSLLQTLVSCCTGGLLKFGPVFCKFVVQILKWTSVSPKYGMERPYRHLREMAYKFLESWILRAKAASCAQLLDEDLVTYILQDIHQKKESVVLQVKGNGNQASSGCQVHQKRLELLDSKANSGPCEAALRVSCALVQTSGSELKLPLHVRLQETAVSLLLDVRNSSGPEDMPSPYSVIGCRLQLYRLLSVLTLHPHPRWPPPTQFALSLLPWGQHDESLEIVEFSTMAMLCIRQMVHPSHSSPQFPKTVKEMRTSVGLCCREKDADVNAISPHSSLSANLKEYNMIQIVNDSVGEQASHTRPNNKKSGKKKLSSPLCVVSVNGVETNSQTPDSSKRKRKSHTPINEVLVGDKGQKQKIPNSDKPSKKIQPSLFTVSTSLITSCRKRNRNSGQDWEVTEVVTKQEEGSKKKKKKINNEFIEQSLSPPGKIRIKGSPKNISEGNKSRKQSEPIVHEEIPVIDLSENNDEVTDRVEGTLSNQETIYKEAFIISDDTATEEVPLVELAESDVSDSFALRLESEGESFEIQDVTSETGGDMDTSEKGRSVIDVLTREMYASNNSSGMSINKVKDLTMSDRELEETNVGMEAIAESPDAVSVTDAASNEEESTANNLQVAGTQKSRNANEISLTDNPDGTSKKDAKETSDREMEETNAGMEAVVQSPDVALEEAAVVNEEQSAVEKLHTEEIELGSSGKEASTTNHPDGVSVRNTKDVATSDREMEEKNSGMEAIVHSPDVALEEAAASNDTKKLQMKGMEDSNDSDTAEEDILKTFVDVVSPKST